VNEESSTALEEAIEAFRQAWIQGRPRDLEEFCREHSRLEPELRRRLESFLFVVRGLGPANAKRAAHSAPSPGTVLGDFRLLSEIGRGGMGVVFEAEQLSLERRVAIKVLPTQLTSHSQAVQRFQREALAASRLHHPGIVSVYSLGQEGELYFFSMELIEGTSLDRLLEKAGDEPLQIELVCSLVAAVADALDHAHQQGVIHRDVKPSNILLTREGDSKLTDFGIARVADYPAVTRTGDFSGTPHYASPEQAAPGHNPIDARTDVYSLGVTLYEILTGQRPFLGDSSREILARIASREATPPRQLNPSIPRDLETICLMAMEKSPERRYPSAAEFALDLRRFLKFQPIQARPVGRTTRVLRWTRRHPARATALLLGLTVVLTAPTILQLKLREQRVRALARDTSMAFEGCRQVWNLVGERRLGQAWDSTLEGILNAPTRQALAEVVENTIAGAQGAFANRPEERIQLLRLLGRTCRVLQQYPEAQAFLESARCEAEHHLSEENAESLLVKLALLRLYEDQRRYREANEAADWVLLGAGKNPELLPAVHTDLARVYLERSRREPNLVKESIEQAARHADIAAQKTSVEDLGDRSRQLLAETLRSADPFRDRQPTGILQGMPLLFYCVERGSESEIRCLDDDGKNGRVDTGSSSARSPAVNRTGEILCFWRDEGSSRKALCILNLKKGELRTLCTLDAAPVGHPGWHPDGSKIYFGRGSREHGPHGWSIVWVEVEGSSDQQPEILLAGDEQFYNSPSISPDGGRIAYLHYPDHSWAPDTEVWVGRLLDEGRRVGSRARLTKDRLADDGCQFSPSGDLYWFSNWMKLNWVQRFRLAGKALPGSGEALPNPPEVVASTLFDGEIDIHRVAAGSNGWVAYDTHQRPWAEIHILAQDGSLAYVLAEPGGICADPAFGSE
jgi:serine/threonine protein kinase